MSTHQDQRKPVRIVAQSNAQRGILKTVNIRTTAPADKHQAQECVQLTAAQAKVHDHATFMDSGGTIAGLRTIYIAGYSAPN